MAAWYRFALYAMLCLVYHFIIIFIFRPPVYGSNGRTYTMLVMFFSFFSSRVLRVPSTDRPETLPHGRNLRVFYNASPKIRRALPQKNLGAKNMQNFSQFWTTSDFDREYLRNEATYPKWDGKDARTRKIPPAFNEKGPVNFGPLTAWNYMWVWIH